MFGQGGPQIIVRGKGLCNSEKDFVLAKPRALFHNWHNALGTGLTDPEGGPGRPSRCAGRHLLPAFLGRVSGGGLGIFGLIVCPP